MWNSLVISGYGNVEDLSLEAGTYWTDHVKLYDNITTHAFQYKIVSAGAGAVTITPYTSITQQNWISNGSKLSSATKTSGPDSDGLDTIPMNIKPAEFIKFKIVVAVAVVDLTLEFVQK